MRIHFRHWILRGAAVITAAVAVEYATQFVRSFALSRLLGPTEFGIASAMAIMWALIDMSTGLGADRYLVQARDGDTESALAVAHALTLARSTLSATLLAVLAFPTAHLLGVPQCSGSFVWLAVIPLVRGFEHLRLEQLQRAHLFWPWATANAMTNVLGLVVGTCAAFVLRDHRAVLWGLGTQAVTVVAATHVFAGLKYRVSFAAEPAVRALRFGLPLMLNGLALATLGQFDRPVVGSFLGVAMLGRYGLATMMFYLPTSLLARVAVSVLQPRLSGAWHDSPLFVFPRLFRQLNAAIALTAALGGTMVAIAGSPLLSFVFGHAYAVSDMFFAIFSLAIFVRFAKISANLAGLAMGRTMHLMLSNMPSALGLVGTIVGLSLVPSLVVAAVGLLAGELLGAVTAFVLLGRNLNVSGAILGAPFLVTCPIPCVAAVWIALAQPSYAMRGMVVAGLALCIGLTALLLRQRMWPQAVG
jgi:O-antigen/teichoic acid export membrane protein